MAKYIAHLYKEGYETKERVPKEVGVITAIECEAEEEVLEIPDHVDEFEAPITHIGFEYEFDPAHEVWADWHHPSKGCDYEPDRHVLRHICLKLPSSIKKVIIPQTVDHISYYAWDGTDKIVFEVHPDNPRYTTENGKIVSKEKLI